ncbi:MAG: diguanylate cyclase [Deltaproteobacteria bacterium]|nr:diguanylate cyclase [Deltaproteobacteria bacterium]
MKTRYSHKLLSLIALFMILGISVTTYYTISREQKLIAEIGVDEAEHTTHMTFEALHASMVNGGGRAGNRAIVQNLAKDSDDIEEIRIIHGPGIDKQYGAEADEGVTDELDAEGLTGKEIQKIIEHRDGTRSARFVKPFVVTKECLGCHTGTVGDVNGAISVTVSLKEYDKAISDMTFKTIVAGIVITIVSLILCAIFVFRVSIKPINELQKAASIIGSGDLDHRINIRGGLEINQLVDEFNSMAEKLKARTEEMHLLNKQLEKLSITDGLTGAFNHRHFYLKLEEEIMRSARYHKTFSIILMDVDHFKRYNDTYGHLNGDIALKTVANSIRNSIRSSDLLARYGGEEFAVILAETEKSHAMELAERIRADVEASTITFNDDAPGEKVTISLGVATFPDDARLGLDLIRQADEALYKAKETGRNNVKSA